ncbi:multidrug transport protein [Bifidobacterium saguini DSM 23967]|uniref:Multidrug transport protein n=2 Tax=Bifidobacterium saguini TaxID=762210 RepID=A0A087DF25_9BIFI|nr:MFS transporter [Bifidobacterium saguini]KFI94125.1 multidrug transport protein [Bifidobacterium saguini DSM 23967]QTB90425.1 MFS transporter [Bifidobacterium saguini]
MPALSAQAQGSDSINGPTDNDSFMNGSIILIMAAAFFYMSGTMMGTTLIVGYSHTLGASGEFAGIIAGTMNIISLFCRPWAGHLSDRAPLKRFAAIAIALLIAANAGYLCSPNATTLFAARIINGVGFSCLSVCLAAWLTALIPLAHIGKGMGYYGMVNALAMALGPAVGIHMRSALGYRAAFAIACAEMIIALVLVLMVCKGGSRPTQRTPATVTVSALTRAQQQPQSANLRDRIEQTISVRVIPVALVFMLFAIPYCATQSYIVTYAEARNLSVDVSLFFPLYAAALLILRVAMRNLFDRRPFSWFLWACSACMIVALGALTVLGNNGILLIAAIFMAASYGIMSSVSQSDAVRLAGTGHGGRGNATYYIGLDLGMALGPIIGGGLYANVNLAWFYPILMLTIPAAIIVYLLTSHHASKATDCHI